MSHTDTYCKSYDPCRTSYYTSCNCSNCNVHKLQNTCDLEGVHPAILSIPFPDIKVTCKNKYYADLLSEDYCGTGSEFTAITQYINHEIRISGKCCQTARTLLAIAQAEMIHLQMLGELIVLLGKPLTYNATIEHCSMLWTPGTIKLGTNYNNMICADIDGEYEAIRQYEDHLKKIKDPYIKDILKRIIMDEKYHISLLKKLFK